MPSAGRIVQFKSTRADRMVWGNAANNLV